MLEKNKETLVHVQGLNGVGVVRRGVEAILKQGSRLPNKKEENSGAASKIVKKGKKGRRARTRQNRQGKTLDTFSHSEKKNTHD